MQQFIRCNGTSILRTWQVNKTPCIIYNISLIVQCSATPRKILRIPTVHCTPTRDDIVDSNWLIFIDLSQIIVMMSGDQSNYSEWLLNNTTVNSNITLISKTGIGQIKVHALQCKHSGHTIIEALTTLLHKVTAPSLI